MKCSKILDSVNLRVCMEIQRLTNAGAIYVNKNLCSLSRVVYKKKLEKNI